MEQSKIRREVFSKIRNRAAAIVTQKIDDSGALQLALCCSLRDPKLVTGFMFNRQLVREIQEKEKQIALTRDEFRILFSSSSAPIRKTGLSVVNSREFQEAFLSVESALRCTITEPAQASVWASAWGRAIAFVSVHFRAPETALETVLGVVVRSDYRRLEELYDLIDDEGYDALLLSAVITALSTSVI